MNRLQELHFELIREASFNQFDGPRVADALEQHPHLWQAVVMWREDSGDLICLRDLPDGEWNVDTLYILSSGEDDAALESLALVWEADEVSWLPDDEASPRLGWWPASKRVLRCWWD